MEKINKKEANIHYRNYKRKHTHTQILPNRIGYLDNARCFSCMLFTEQNRRCYACLEKLVHYWKSRKTGKTYHEGETRTNYKALNRHNTEYWAKLRKRKRKRSKA